MKRLSIVIVCLCVVGIIATTSWTRAQDQPEPSPTPSFNVVIGDDVFLRGGPGETFLPVGALRAGDIINPVSRNEDSTWIMITYRRGFGWIRRDLAYWVTTIFLLPVIDADNLTPTPASTALTATPFFPTETPEGNYIDVFGANSALVRGGPGRTYLRLGQLFPGDIVEPVGRNARGSWILIRFAPPPGADVLGAEFEFGWIQRDLVAWQDEDSLDELPVLDEDNLTPTLTFTPSATPTDTATPTASNTATATHTPSNTPTATLTPTLTPTFTATNTPTSTATDTATSTSTNTPTETLTATNSPEPPTATNTSVPTETLIPTDTATSTPSPEPTVTIKPTDTFTPVSPTPLPTETDEPTEEVAVIVPTDTESPTNTPELSTETLTSTVTLTETSVPTLMDTFTPIPPTRTPTETEEAVVIVPTDTELPTNTPILTEMPVTETAESTEEVVAIIETEEPTVSSQVAVVSPDDPEAVSDDGGDFPVEAAIGGIGILLVLLYVGLYLRGVALVERYASGFVIEGCPVCQRGHLTVDTKVERTFGIPRPRRTVRCNECRSVLRQTGDGWWRYAVDRLENPAIYDRFNNREIDDSTLVSLGREPIRTADNRSPQSATFVDDEGSED